jgi:hypothetical protein
MVPDSMTPSLTCRTCGAPAVHVHFIPWIEQPDRVELACADHTPKGDDGDWFTLDELTAEPVAYMRSVGRSASPAPKALTAWLTGLASKGKPQAVPEVEVAQPPATGPLTVKEAAARERVNERTIRRRLPELEASGGAWRVGTAWRIDAAALDRLRVEGQRPTRRPERQRPTAADVKGKPKATTSRVWNRP